MTCVPQKQCGSECRTARFIRTLSTALLQACVTGKYSVISIRSQYSLVIFLYNSVISIRGQYSLVISLYNSVISVTGHGKSAKFSSDDFKRRSIVLKKYADNSKDLHMETLYAFQLGMHQLDHPPRTCRRL